VRDDGDVEDGLKGDGGRCAHGGWFPSLVAECGLKLGFAARFLEGARGWREGENARLF